ncbi:MAG: response regulator, partial [Saprospiraceae bacterium]|nr:response regulator [Saprospiraceae bacterium]
MSKQFDLLVIDDEQVILDAITRVCSSAGWRVQSALDAAAGLEELAASQTRLIICDIMLPGMDGFQFLEE